MTVVVRHVVFKISRILDFFSQCTIHEWIVPQLYDKFKKIRDIADRELVDHERTFDSNNMRDFVDVYICQMKEANKEARTDSTFFGEEGRLQFENVISDLLFVSYIWYSPFI